MTYDYDILSINDNDVSQFKEDINNKVCSMWKKTTTLK